MTGCSNLTEIKISGSSATTISSDKSTELALYAAINNYTATESEMENSLLNILYANTLPTKASVTTNPYTISLKKTDSISFKNSLAENRNAVTDEYDSVPLYLYTVTNIDNGAEGFAITTTDRRIGLVLAVAEEGELTDDDELTSYILERITDYIDYTSSIWNSLSTTQINNAKSAYASYGESSDYTFSDFTYNSGNESIILPTKWNQTTPFNDVINAIKNDGSTYLSGCGPIAMAQIFTKVRPFNSCSVSGYEDVIYEWDKMLVTNGWFTSNTSNHYAFGSYYSDTVKKEVAALVYEIGSGMNASFGTEGTGVYDSDVKSYLSNNSISFSYDNYNYDNVVKSIDNGSPVYLSGYAKKKVTKKKILGITYSTSTSYSDGHAFVADGYANYSCNVTDSDNNITSITTDFVHINFGWQDGSKDGFYLSEIFNSNNAPLSDNDRSSTTYGSSGYYQYQLNTFYNIGK